jgi:hypothetical protein
MSNIIGDQPILAEEVILQYSRSQLSGARIEPPIRLTLGRAPSVRSIRTDEHLAFTRPRRSGERDSQLLARTSLDEKRL